MEVLFVLLPLSLLFAGASVGLFVWAVRRGQFEDLETPPLRILFDDEPRSDRARVASKAGTTDETRK